MLGAARCVPVVMLAIAAGSLTLACGAKCKCGDLGNNGSDAAQSAPPPDAGDQAAIDSTNASTPPDASSFSVGDAPVDDGSDTDVFEGFPEASSDTGSSPAPIADAGSGCACAKLEGAPCGQANGGCGCCAGTGLLCGGNNRCFGLPP